MNRPIGIAIIAILNIISAIFLILSGLGLAGTAGADLASGGTLTPERVGADEGLGVAGILSLVLGVVTLIVAIALWRLKPWAWYVSLILSIIALVMAIYAGTQTGFSTPQIISIVLYALLIFYLFSVRNHFTGPVTS